MKAKKKCTVENIRNNLGRNSTHAEQRQEKLWEVCRQLAGPGSKCWLVLRNLLSLHFGAESHQPAARGVTKQILLGAVLILAQPSVIVSMIKIFDSLEQHVNVKKTSFRKLVLLKLLLWEIKFEMWNDQVIWTKLPDTDIIYNVVSGTAMASLNSPRETEDKLSSSRRTFIQSLARTAIMILVTGHRSSCSYRPIVASNVRYRTNLEQNGFLST